MDIVKIDGVDYHAYDDGNPVTDEHGELIEATVCICAAHSEYECCCGAWSRPLNEI